MLSIFFFFFSEYEGSGTEVQRKHSKCGVCKYRAECDEDAENVGYVMFPLTISLNKREKILVVHDYLLDYVYSY